MISEEMAALYMLNSEAIGSDKKWSYGSVLRGMVQYNRKAREIAAQRNLLLIDLEKQVPKTLDYFWDDVHYSQKTYDLIANYIVSEMLFGHAVRR
jgi:hypothetical protein